MWINDYDLFDDIIDKIQIDNQGNVYVLAFDYLFYEIKKFDSKTGSMYWNTKLSGPNNWHFEAFVFSIDHYNHIYVSVKSSFNGTDNDLLTACYDSDGNKIWESIFDEGFINDIFASMCDKLGNIYLIVKNDIDNSFDDYLIIKYNSTGKLLFAKRFGDLSNLYLEMFADCKCDSAGNVYITGAIRTANESLCNVKI